MLQKQGRLTEGEWELMRQHPAIGERIVAATATLAHLAPAVRAEHERWDGRGYPDGLAETAIPIASRIVLACDAYHAMTSDRPYRAALGPEAAREELRSHAGSQFDPVVVARSSPSSRPRSWSSIPWQPPPRRRDYRRRMAITRRSP